MKRFYFILILVASLLLTSCAATRYVSQREVYDREEASMIIYTHYPQLYKFYIDGTLVIRSLIEVVLPDGTTDYRLRYEFTYYPYYGGTYIRYRNRPHVYYRPGPKPRPRVQPAPPRHRPQPNARPNNPHHRPQPNVRPNNNPPRNNNHGGNTRPPQGGGHRGRR